MESGHCGQDKRIFFCPVHNASAPCSLQAFGIRCIGSRLTGLLTKDWNQEQLSIFSLV